MVSPTPLHRRSRLLVRLLVSLAVLLSLSACALVKDTSKQSTEPTTVPADVAQVQVLAVGFGNEFDQQGRPINLRTVLPAGVQKVGAYVLLGGVKAGMNVEGRWFELGTGNSGAEGEQITQSTVALDANGIDPASGRASAFFFLASGTSALPEDSWLLRVYVDGHLVHTAAMIISSAVGDVGATPASQPASPSPAASPAP